MCLAIPAKVVSIKNDKAEVDFGEGVLREVNVTLVKAKIGDYVLVHAGYAIQDIISNFRFMSWCMRATPFKFWMKKKHKRR